MKNKFKYILAALLVVCIAGGAYYLGTQKTQPAQPDQTEQPSQPEPQQIVAQESPAPAEPPATEVISPEENFELTQEDLYTQYEKVYQRVANSNAEFIDIFEQIDFEISCASVIYISNNMPIPADHADSYIAWRDEYHPVSEAPDKEIIDDETNLTYDAEEDAYYVLDNPTDSATNQESTDIDKAEDGSVTVIDISGGGSIGNEAGPRPNVSDLELIG